MVRRTRIVMLGLLVLIDAVTGWISPGGATAGSDETVLPDGGVAHLSTRAFANGGAGLRLTVSWPRDGE